MPPHSNANFAFGKQANNPKQNKKRKALLRPPFAPNRADFLFNYFYFGNEK